MTPGVNWDNKIIASNTIDRRGGSETLSEDAEHLSFDDGEPPFVEDDIEPTENRFRLEALEPRVLLSADPISGEFARLLDGSEDDSEADDIAALILEVDLAASAETEFLDAASDEIAAGKITMDWPKAWLANDDAGEQHSAAEHGPNWGTCWSQNGCEPWPGDWSSLPPAGL